MNDDLRQHWTLDRDVVFMNHGSFGACPSEVLAYQQELRDRLEREPVRFFVRESRALWNASRERLGEFIDADPADLVFVTNATEGANAVLRSLDWQRDDTILVTDHGYAACTNAVSFVAARFGARVKVAEIPWPGTDEQAVVDAVLGALDGSVRLALLDHITSPTGMVLPIERLVAELKARGVDTLVDGAHAAGMVPLSVRKVGAAYYTGNCHKWLCAPKGAGFLVTDRSRQVGVVPTNVSHGYTAGPQTRFHRMFDWTGTSDPTAAMSVGKAIDVMASLVDGGWDAIRTTNRALALKGRDILAQALGVDPPCADSMIGSLAALPLGVGPKPDPADPERLYPLQNTLWNGHRIEVPITGYPGWPGRIIRISAQLYNSVDDYETLAKALVDALAAEGGQ